MTDMKKILIIALSLIALDFSNAPAQNIALQKLASASDNWFEGFRKNLGENTFSYSTFRNDVTDALLTRCTDGKMKIEWETAPVPANWTQKEASFLWMAALDLTPKHEVFDVAVNGVKRFEIHTSEKQSWEISTTDGGRLGFVPVETDQFGDAHGYMTLAAPESWLQKGAGQTISITGRAGNEDTWIIVFRATDALSFLHHSMMNDVWMKVETETSLNPMKVRIQASGTLAGKELIVTAGRKTTLRLAEKDGIASGELLLPQSAKNKVLEISDNLGAILYVQSLGSPGQSTLLLDSSVVVSDSRMDGSKLIITGQRNYQPVMVTSLLNLSGSFLAKGKICLMNSSHQDIAWMDSPEKCILERDTMLLTPLIRKAQNDKNYRFDVEDALMLREYIGRHPESKQTIGEMLADGRLSCGSTYSQPYEEMYSGEALARQFYLGAKWLKDQFGYDATVYWNEDVPGRTPQMMQLMRKAGTSSMMISRQEKGLYHWYSPDGSYVTVFSPGHYANTFADLQKNFYAAANSLAGNALYWMPYYTPKSKSPVIPLLSDWDMSPAKDYTPLITQWNSIREHEPAKGKISPVHLPEFTIVTAPEFFRELQAANPVIKSISGERPDVWLYIHGPSHEKALHASREADILLTEAEKFATANALAAGTFKNYPQERLTRAWEAKIYPDHGWGGKHGDITDDLFLSKFEFAKCEASDILQQSLNELASRIKTDLTKGRPLAVFNSMNEQRTDPVSAKVQFIRGQAFDVKLVDAGGQETRVQLSNCLYYPDGSMKSATLHFMASKVPAIGYKTFYLQELNTPHQKENATFSGEMENRFYKIRFTNGGLASIFDKELHAELVHPGKFAAGEVFTMRSVGNGAGEFADVQQPDMEGFDRAGNYPTHWSVTENGDVYTTFSYRQKIRYAEVEQQIRIYHQEKRIDFETRLLNWQGVLYREFRMALPLNMEGGQVAYEVPFGTVEVGKDELAGAAGERYTVPCKNIHPRGIENWIGASGSSFGVTMSSSVAVADWIDPTTNPLQVPVLQPILLASRRSCHGEGNEYLQTGDHAFRFSITSHQPGWINGADFGRGANEPMQAVWADEPYATASLPETMSFFHAEGAHVLVSAVKKAEDSDDVIVRMADMEGKDKQVTFSCFRPIQQASHTSLVEQEDGSIPVVSNTLKFSLGHHAIETFKIGF